MFAGNLECCSPRVPVVSLPAYLAVEPVRPIATLYARPRLSLADGGVAVALASLAGGEVPEAWKGWLGLHEVS